MMRKYDEKRVGEKISEKDELAQFPGLSRRELERVNSFFKHYLFYRTCGKGREVWTSCCHQKQRYIDLQEKTITPELRDALWGSHNMKIRCPFCGEDVTIKCAGKIGRGAGLEEYQKVVFLHCSQDGNTIYAQGYWVKKEYCKEATDTLSAEPLYMATVVYRFRPGEAVWWENNSSGWNRCTGCFGEEPFRRSGLYGGVEPYHVIGLRRLKQSFLRYIDVPKALRILERWNTSTQRTEVLMRFLTLAAQYPKQTEMLMKMGLQELVKDWIFYKRKNAAVLRWDEENPKAAFNLSGAALKAWIASGGNPKTLKIQKILKKAGIRAGIEDAAQISEALYQDPKALQQLLQRSAQWHTEGKRVLRYLWSFTGGCHLGGGYRSLHTVLRIWIDYLDAAEGNGVELWKKKNLLPEDLWSAHDEETKKQRERLEAARNQEARDKAERERAVWNQRTAEVRRKYAVEMDGLVIVAPACEQDILNEGKALCHCVGGYADRHRDGVTTILFLRRAEAPGEPYLTIEMNGNRLVQIHGYRNEGLYTGTGRFAPDPKETYHDWLESWVTWLKAGSKRRKDGTPILPKKKKKQAVCAA